MPKTTNKQLIYFDADAFNKASQSFKEYSELLSAVKNELETLTNTKLTEFITENPLQWYYNHLQNDTNNIMNLRGQAIAEAQSKDLTRLKALDIKLKQATQATAPTIADFSSYATTPEQMERLEKSKKLLEVYDDFIKLEGNQDLKFAMIAKATPFRFNLDHKLQKLYPNPNYIINGKISIYG